MVTKIGVLRDFDCGVYHPRKISKLFNAVREGEPELFADCTVGNAVWPVVVDGDGCGGGYH